VELAALAAGVDRRRQLGQQRGVEVARREPLVQGARIDAGQPGAQPAGDHLGRQRAGRLAPQREEWPDPGRGQLLLAVAADVLQEQIAERHGGDARGARPIEGGRHRRFVLGVAARPGDRHRPERQVRGGGLRAQELGPDRVHRHAIGRLVDRRQEAHHLDFTGGAQEVQRPGAVLPAAPGQQRLRPGGHGGQASEQVTTA
jgi:hypothetical protein